MKKTFSFLLLATFLFTSCGKAEVTTTTEVKPKYVKSQTVEKKTFAEDLKLIGKVSASQETTISPLTSGVINKINVNVGDKVNAGQILATIDTQSNLTNVNLNNALNTYNNTVTVYNATKESLQKNLDSAKLQYDNAVISRDNIFATTQKQLELAQAQLSGVVTQKGNTSASSNLSVKLAEENLKNAQLALENFNKNSNETLTTLETKKRSLIDNMRVSMDSFFATIDTSLNLIDTILGVTPQNKNLNDSYEIYLSAKDTTLKNDAENMFRNTNPKFFELKGSYNSNLSDDEVLALYPKVLTMTDTVVNLYDKMSSVLDNTITSITLTDTTLSGFKTSVKTYQTQVLSLKSNLITLNNSLKEVNNSVASTNTNLETQKASLEQAIKISQASLDSTKAGGNSSNDSVSTTENTTKIQLESTIENIKSSRDSAENAVKIALNQYNSAKANYNSQLASTKSQLDSASGQKNSLNQQLDNSSIKAPFDGIITSKNIEVGGSVSQSVQAFGIANSNQKIIKLDVNSDNVKYLQVGKEVKLGKNDKTSTGTITVLGASADESTQMFKVEITFKNDDFNSALVLGDFVDVYIQKEVKDEKFMIIPFSSLIVGTNDSYTVYVIGNENKVEERQVTIGSSNSSEIVILSGLKEGDKVITSGALNVSVGDKVEESTN